MKFGGDVAAPFLLGALLIGAPACSRTRETVRSVRL